MEVRTIKNANCGNWMMPPAIKSTKDKPKNSFQLMLTNHVGSGYQNPGFGTLGFGYGFELTLDMAKSPHLGSAGDFGYRSAYFTRYMGDPAEQMSAIFLAQLSNYGGTSDLHYKWRSTVYQALVEPAAPRR